MPDPCYHTAPNTCQNVKQLLATHLGGELAPCVTPSRVGHVVLSLTHIPTRIQNPSAYQFIFVFESAPRSECRSGQETELWPPTIESNRRRLPIEVAQRMKPLLTVSGPKLTQKHIHPRAFDIYCVHPFLDFEDGPSVAIFGDQV